MRLFHCDACGNLLFFENSRCLQCGSAVGFDPHRGRLIALDESRNRRCSGGAPACNWLTQAADADDRCRSCRMTDMHPQSNGPDAAAWEKLELAKRRLLQTLGNLGLSIDGLFFAFPAAGLTGHCNGLITVVLAEADDAERIRRQRELGEPLRTLIGHFRHESGHFYQPWLVDEETESSRFRALFGDERVDYQSALQNYYAAGPQLVWQMTFVSGYASAHPHEDWAECWAHYLHIYDAVELAVAYGLSLEPDHTTADAQTPHINLRQTMPDDFSELMRCWVPLSWFANSLNRSLGHPDWYAFVTTPPVYEKLRYIHELIQRHRSHRTGQAALQRSA